MSWALAALMSPMVLGVPSLGNATSSTVRARSRAAVEPSVLTSTAVTGSAASSSGDVAAAGQLGTPCAALVVTLATPPEPTVTGTDATIAPGAQRPSAGIRASSAQATTPGGGPPNSGTGTDGSTWMAATPRTPPIALSLLSRSLGTAVPVGTGRPPVPES